jgi:L-lactate dehydrogenase complex protein LldG
MSSRHEILDRVRKNQPAPRPLPGVPTFDAGVPASLDAFRTALIRMGGRFVPPADDQDLDAQIHALFPDARVVCSATPEVKGNRPIDSIRAPRELHDVDVGVVRAVFGVAETGSLWLSDAQFGVNALGFLSQHLVVLLDPEAIVTNMHRAYQHPGLFEANYSVFMTGPSATADIEGVLIHGAQGVRTMSVIPCRRNARVPLQPERP